MRELPVRARVPWLVLPVVAFGFTVAVTTAGADRQPLTADDLGLLIQGVLVVFALPLLTMLALVRTPWGWAVGVLLLTGLCVAAPVMADAASDESSTAGLAYLLIPFYGTVAAALLALAEAILRRRASP